MNSSAFEAPLTWHEPQLMPPLSAAPTEDGGRIERHVAKLHQIRFLTTDGFGMKHLPRLVQRIIVQLGSDGKRRLRVHDRKGKRVLKQPTPLQGRPPQTETLERSPLALDFL